MKCPPSVDMEVPDMSPPSRGAWIEMGGQKEFEQIWEVAPLAGGVD